MSIDISDGTMVCSCMNFARFGYLCRHIFCVMKGKAIEVIPEKYILRRWMRDILPPDIRKKRNLNNTEGDKIMELSSTAYSAVDYCLNILAKDIPKLTEYVESIKRLKTEVEEANPNAKPLSKKEMFNIQLGVEKPDTNVVQNPDRCKTKGDGDVSKRMRSDLEKARDHLKKKRRFCKKCRKRRRHDSRNCTWNEIEIAYDSDSTVYSD